MATFDCIARLTQAAGRKLSYTEIQDIFERINKAANDIKAGRKIPPAGRTGLQGVIDTVAQEAAAAKVADAERTQNNAALQIIRMSQRTDDLKAIKGGGFTPVSAIERLIANFADGRANQFSLEAKYLGIKADMQRKVEDTFRALGDDFLGFIQDKEKISLLVREMKGENTGDALAKKGAKAWLDTAEEFRQRFNDLGGKIGKLEDWAMPQHHSQELVARAGKDAWVDAVLPALNRAKYVDDAGVAMNEAQLRAFLGKAWETISSNGYNKIEPGKFQGTGARANRGAEERQIHFKDADAYLNYWGVFGDKTFPDILTAHVDGLARDIALVDHFGPNPDAAYRTLRDQAILEQSKAALASTDEKVRAGGVPAIEKETVKLERLWDIASGKVEPVASRAIANFFDHVRNLNVAGKLGSAFWASFFGDKVMMETMSHLNNIPMLSRWADEMRILNPLNGAERRILERNGLMLDYMRTAMTRWGEGYGQSSWSGKLANAVMRVSGMNAINEWRRGAWSLSLTSALGHMVDTMPWAKVDKTDMHLMDSYGINERDWSIWKLAQLEDLGHGNAKALTADTLARIPTADLQAALPLEFGGALGVTAAEAESIASRIRFESVTKLLGAINSESRNAIITPGWSDRARIEKITPGGKGTVGGELMRSFWQFKSFPMAQFVRMWEIAMSRETTASKAGTLAAIMSMQAVAGMMIIQTRDMLTGKDPRPMTKDGVPDWKFGLASFLQGGALGVYGDFLYGLNQTRYGTGPLEVAAGPTLGPALDFLTSSFQAAKAKTEGKDTHLLAHYMNIGKGFIPGNNLWYTKAAVDHILFQNVQEQLSPGYLSTMRARTMKDYGQDWWYSPGETTPSRAPDFSNVLNR